MGMEGGWGGEEKIREEGDGERWHVIAFELAVSTCRSSSMDVVKAC